MKRHLMGAVLCLAALPFALHAQTTMRANGTDRFVAGPSLPLDQEVPGDLFVAGNNVTLRGHTRDDAHAAGFNLEIGGPVDGNLYAAGANVALEAHVGKDATIAGWSVHLRDTGAVAGNARLGGGTVIVEAPVTGALTAAGSEVTINATVGGDAWIMAERLAFGPRARLDGRLVYSSAEPVTIPAEVVPPDRVTFESSPVPGAVREARRGWEERHWRSWPAMLPVLSGGFLALGFLLFVGALFLGLAPRAVETAQAMATTRPGRVLLLGIGSLSCLFGLVPVLALTLLGLPLVPVALLVAAAGWVLGYLLGIYAMTHRLAAGFRARSRAPASEPGSAEPAYPLVSRILLLAAGLILAALLNFIPILGWMVNVALVLLGLGAIGAGLLDRMGNRLADRAR